MSTWRPNRGYSFSTWDDCTRCGLPWPTEELHMQNGILICPECWDDPGQKDLLQEHRAEEGTPRPRLWEADK